MVRTSGSGIFFFNLFVRDAPDAKKGVAGTGDAAAAAALMLAAAGAVRSRKPLGDKGTIVGIKNRV